MDPLRFILLLLFISFKTEAQVFVEPLFGNGKRLELKESTLKNRLVMFFKSECSSCRAQVKDLNCLDKNQVLFLAFSSELEALKKEARIMSLKQNVYYASPLVTKSFGLTKNYSPVIFAFNKQGKSKSWLGLQNCAVFAKYLSSSVESL